MIKLIDNYLLIYRKKIKDIKETILIIISSVLIITKIYD
jgi:hypothetical protein